MNFCSNCGTTLKENAKFCPKCGKPVQKNNTRDTTVQTHTLYPETRKSFPVNKALLAGSLLVVLLFAGIFYFNETMPNENAILNTEQLTNLEGNWHDPNGSLLGDKETVIVLKKKGELVVGSDSQKRINMTLTPMGSNNYGAMVTVRGVESDFEVHFYEEEDKLVFFSTLTKTSWNIKKLKQ